METGTNLCLRAAILFYVVNLYTYFEAAATVLLSYKVTEVTFCHVTSIGPIVMNVLSHLVTTSCK